MAIILPGIDVGPTGSKALPVGAASDLDRVPHEHPLTVKRLLAAMASVAPRILGRIGSPDRRGEADRSKGDFVVQPLLDLPRPYYLSE